MIYQNILLISVFFFFVVVNHIHHVEIFPKKIVELMNEPGLTRENVASHLQVRKR